MEPYQVQSHTVISSGYIGINTLCLLSLGFSVPACNTLAVHFYLVSFPPSLSLFIIIIQETPSYYELLGKLFSSPQAVSS